MTTTNEGTERDELLVDILASALANLTDYADPPGEIADTILSEGYRKPRTITTVGELDALPVGTVILDGGNMGAQWDGEMWSGEGRWWHSTQIAFPATVLHEPEAEATR